METLKEHKDLLEVAEHFFNDGKLIQAISYATASLDLTISVAKATILDLKPNQDSSLEEFPPHHTTYSAAPNYGCKHSLKRVLEIG
ncbi:MAG: hypothetical protein RIC07_05280 [Coleofasciculus sp. E1-EBD-02]